MYIVASSRQQASLAPLVVGLVSSLLHTAAERSNAGDPLDRTLRLLLDEAANIAPLRELPAHLSQAAGHGIRMATMWQSVGQIHHRYGDAADDVLANSTVKLFLGPISDERTRRYAQGMLGDEPSPPPKTGPSPPGGRPARAPMADAASLRQLLPDRALMLEGRTAPAVIRLNAWWKDPALRARAASVHPTP